VERWSEWEWSGVGVDILAPGATAQQRVVSGNSGQIEAIIDVSTWERGCLPVSSFTASPSPRIACCHAPRTEGHPEANPLLTPLPKRFTVVARAGWKGLERCRCDAVLGRGNTQSRNHKMACALEDHRSDARGIASEMGGATGQCPVTRRPAWPGVQQLCSTRKANF
jgi:hypothetical protein